MSMLWGWVRPLFANAFEGIGDTSILVSNMVEEETI